MKRIAAVLLLFLVACSGETPTPQTTRVVQTPAATKIPDLSPTSTTTWNEIVLSTPHHEYPSSTRVGCRAEDEQKLPFSQPEPTLAGLVFMQGNDMWRINASGKPDLISCMPPVGRPEPGICLSNKGDLVAYKEQNVIWLAEIATGYVRRVSPVVGDTTEFEFVSWSADDQFIFIVDRIEPPNGNERVNNTWAYEIASGSSRPITNAHAAYSYAGLSGQIQQWTGKPDWVIYLTPPKTDEVGEGVIGYLVAQNLKTGEEKRLVEKVLWNQIAVSSDGTKIVYHTVGGDDYNWYWRSEETIVRLPINDYKVPGWKISESFDPVWSPDGKHLAMVVHARPINDPTQNFTGIAIFNLAQATGILLHPFHNPDKIDMRWSPDGQWIALYAADFDVARSGLWLLKTDSSQEIHYPDMSGIPQFIWSPDSQALIIANSCNWDNNACIIWAPEWKVEPLSWRADRMIRWDQVVNQPLR